MNENVLFGLAVTVVGAPLVLLGFTSVVAIWPVASRERLIIIGTYLGIMAGFLASVGIAISMITEQRDTRVLDLGRWVSIPEMEFHFHIRLIFDRLSIPFLFLIYVLCGTVGAFTSRYLHRELGFQRFFILYSLFTLGMVISAVSGTIEVLFFGWELVGLSSALLVSFFHERQAPAMNGLRVWTIYRIADASFLMAAWLLHHLTGEGDLQRMMGVAAWPHVHIELTAGQALGVGLLLLIAAAGKSALIPFSSWLPRAMEGPTASSAIFYGALSVHLGAYMLLRVSPVIYASWVLSASVVALGLATAVYASLVERVQADIKSALAFASLTQVGLIVAEIGMGWQCFALLHLLGHASLRTLQMLRAPSLLQDYFKLETALGHRIAVQPRPPWTFCVPELRNGIYRFALERGFLDAILNRFFVGPFLGLFKLFSRWESAWLQCWEKRFGRSIRVSWKWGPSGERFSKVQPPFQTESGGALREGTSQTESIRSAVGTKWENQDA
jgi:NADH-quinone oxidoreductase subunit L